MRTLAFALILSLPQMASAEYRVFRLMITQRAPASAPVADAATTAAPEAPPPGREVISTLDPDQYRAYNTVQDNEVVSYTQTWMCRGRTGNFRAPCAAPEPIAANPPPVPATSSAPP